LTAVPMFTCLARQARIPHEPTQQSTISCLCLMLRIAPSSKFHIILRPATSLTTPPKHTYRPLTRKIPLVAFRVIHTASCSDLDTDTAWFECRDTVLATDHLYVCHTPRVLCHSARRVLVRVSVPLLCSGEIVEPRRLSYVLGQRWSGVFA
jgi:hypothetical protein